MPLDLASNFVSHNAQSRHYCGANWLNLAKFFHLKFLKINSKVGKFDNLDVVNKMSHTFGHFEPTNSIKSALFRSVIALYFPPSFLITLYFHFMQHSPLILPFILIPRYMPHSMLSEFIDEKIQYLYLNCGG